MSLLRQLSATILCLCLLALAVRPAVAAQDGPAAKPPVRLAVVVVFDQLRGDYLTRWNRLFGEKGFRRLLDDGAWFRNCHYPYAFTFTGPGHASLLTGCAPRTHGILANSWYDRSAGEEVYCAAAGRYRQVPAPRPDPKRKKQRGGGTPDRLLAPTLADALKAATAGKGKVVSLSFKDRSAILPAGRRPDACYWLDTATGTFVTSTYYRDRVHPWVSRFNDRRPADAWFGKGWQRLHPDLDYRKHSGPDDVAGEATGAGQGRTFPHPMGDPKEKQPGRKYYEALYNSPFGNELLLGLVKEAVTAERLGADEVPDLLCVSFSSNDPVGHCWGPDSQEVLDTTLRSDLVVRDLLAFLDEKVGRGRYVLALSSDHGVCPLPEVSRKKGRDARRVAPGVLLLGAEAFLQKRFGKAEESRGGCIESLAGGSIYLNRAWMKARGLRLAEVEEALAGWLRKQPGIQAAYTRTQLLEGVPPDDTVGQAVRLSFHPERSGDVLPVLKPYYLLSSPLGTGTTHGTPHAYDTHVPLLVYGPGVRPGMRKDRVTPLAVVPILAHSLGIKPPSASEVPLPKGLFEVP